MLPTIPTDAHKYSRGSLLVLAGSTRYFGAGVLAAKAAARTGAGYVTLATPGKEAARAARVHLVSIPIIEAHDQDGAFDHNTFKDDLKTLTHIDAIVLGCGITVTSGTQSFVEQVIEFASAKNVPLLLDADALNVLALELALKLTLKPAFEPGKNTSKNLNGESKNGEASPSLILTPHAGELQRLLAATNTNDPQELAKVTDTLVVAKGPTTTITDGKNTICHTKGTPALATAGTGDVLSGVIGALLAQGMSSFAAAQVGVELHSLAGHLAAAQFGERSVVAEDVIDAIPQAIKQLTEL